MLEEREQEIYTKEWLDVKNSVIKMGFTAGEVQWKKFNELEGWFEETTQSSAQILRYESCGGKNKKV